MGVFDHIDINEAYFQYLGLSWKDKYYVYTACPFGMSAAGLIFSKVVRELVRKWRTAGI
jgi:hypothetical protein